jgi:hypothetical protein
VAESAQNLTDVVSQRCCHCIAVVRYGDRFLAPAVDLLNQRLAGADTKELIGKPGLETAYRVKQLVQAIKKSAAEFEAGDEQFLSLVRRAMKGEEETVGKRFTGKLGCPLAGRVAVDYRCPLAGITEP